MFQSSESAEREDSAERGDGIDSLRGGSCSSQVQFANTSRRRTLITTQIDGRDRPTLAKISKNR